MQCSILCIILLCGVALLGAQNVPEWQWAVKAGGDCWNEGQSIAIDSQGNQYVAGQFENTISFGSHTLTANGYEDIFVAKLDQDGNWLWVIQVGGTISDTANSIALDSSDNAWVTGYYGNQATFGDHTLIGGGCFVAKLAPSGNWLWAIKVEGTGNSIGRGIALDGSGNAWVTGQFTRTATFGDHTLTASGNIWSDTFVAKLDPSGNWLWAVKAGGTDFDWVTRIAVDGSGNAWVTGYFDGTSTFGSHTLTAIRFDDIFVAKLDSSGNWLWAVQAGGMYSDRGSGIAVDEVGNAYVTGYYENQASFGNHTLTGVGGFTAKLDPSGNWLWAVQAGATGFDITLDGTGKAYVTGAFYLTATFGNYTLTTSGNDDVFVAKLDSSGNWLWAVKAGGTESDYGYDIALDGAGNACVIGCFRGIVFFGSHILISSGYYDIFVAKLGSVTPVEDDLAPQAVVRLHNAYPNPLGRGASALIKAEIPERSTATLSIFNLRGQIVARHKLNPGLQQISFSGEGLPAGVYLYSLQCGDYRETRKLMLLK